MELHVHSWVLVFLWSLLVSESIESLCGDLHCRNNICSEDGKCLQGCMDGFLADKHGKCADVCSENCSTCVDGVCTVCQSGYFGLRCLQACEGCKNGSCEKNGGKCVNGCKEDFVNPPFCNITHAEHAHSQKQKQLDGEEEMRGLFIWIAGAITLSILSAVVIMVILVVMERYRKLKEPATEHLYQDENDATEIV